MKNLIKFLTDQRYVWLTTILPFGIACLMDFLLLWFTLTVGTKNIPHLYAIAWTLCVCTVWCLMMVILKMNQRYKEVKDGII